MDRAPKTRQLIVSTRTAARRAAVTELLEAHPPGTEIVLAGPTRETVGDYVRTFAQARGATFGLHQFGLWQLVSTIAASELASQGLAPATQLGLEAVAARATFEAIDRGQVAALEEVAVSPGFPGALASTLGELRLAGLDPRALEAGGDELAELRALAEIYEAETGAKKIADRATLLRLATWAWRRPHWASLRAAPLVLCDLHLGSKREAEFVEALLKGTESVLATAPEGDRRTIDALKQAGLQIVRPDAGDAKSPPGAGSGAGPSEGDGEAAPSSLARLRRWLFSDDEPPPGEADDSVRFLSAPGESRECVEIARHVLDEARRGVRFDEMAVFLRAPEIYSVHLETAFRRAGIPVWFSRGTKRPDPSGRAFLSLLACKSEQLSAKRFAEYLSFSQVPDLDAEGAPPPPPADVFVPPADETLGPAAADSQQLSLFGDAPPPEEPPAEAAADEGGLLFGAAADAEEDEAGCLDGSLRAPWKWEELLVEAAVIGGRDRWQRRLDGLAHEYARRRAELQSEDAESPQLQALDRDLGNLRHLERFALPVVERLAGLPDAATWGDWMAALTDLAPRVLRRPERVLEVLAEMAPMAEIGPVGVAEVRAVLTERLSLLEESQPESRFGRVLVAPPDGARGREFRVVFVPGLAERVFPRRPREDPLLLDDYRERLSADLATQEQRGVDERMLLRLAVGTATERLVLSYPRVEVAEGRPRVPSFYALDVARAQRGEIPDWVQLEREAENVANARLAWPAPDDPARAIDDAEHDLATLEGFLEKSGGEARGKARYLLELNDHLARALRSQWARWWKRWWPSDGIIRTTDETAPILQSQRPTERAFSPTSLERFAACPYRFYLSAIQRLEPRLEIAPLVQLDPLTKGSMIHEIQAETLRALRGDDRLPVQAEDLDHVQRVLDDTVDRTAKRWEDELAPAIRRVWLDEVESIRADLRVWLSHLSTSEWTPSFFELTFGLPQGDDAEPQSSADPVEVGEGWKLRGAIDLVERKGDELRITDHKTGRVRVQEGAVVGGGESLQPVLYSLAANRLLDLPVAEARLSYCTARGGFAERIVPINDWSLLQAKQVFERIDRSIADGQLPPAPKKDGCKYCDFRMVCGPHEEARTRRKDRALLRTLQEVRELP